MGHLTLQPNQTKSIYFVPYFQPSLPEEPICRSFTELVVNKTNNHGLCGRVDW